MAKLVFGMSPSLRVFSHEQIGESAMRLVYAPA